MEIQKHGNVAVTTIGVDAYSFSVGAVDTAGIDISLNKFELDKVATNVNGYRIISYGANNQLPVEVANLLAENNLAPEILSKKSSLLWGQGPALYEEVIENDIKKRKYVTNTEIESWLDSWDYIAYLQKSIIEFSHLNGFFTKYFRNKGPRIGAKPFITELEFISSMRSRLEWPEELGGKSKNIITGEFQLSSVQNMKSYPVFNPRNPFAYPVCMSYSSIPTYAMDNEYSIPKFWGNKNWINLSSSIAVLLKAFNKNSAALKYHIETPSIYWEAKKEMLEEQCKREGKVYNNKMLEDLKDEVFKTFANALSNIGNAGKFLTTESLFDNQANEYVGFKINVLDQKVKDYIDAQIDIAKHAALETTMGLGVHPALSNISTDGNLPSGSELLYAFKLYLLTEINIPESVVCKDFNNALKANFPNLKYKMGFYHDVVITESQTSPKDRIKNN